MTVLSILGILLLIALGCCSLHSICGIWCPSIYLTQGYLGRGVDQDCQGRAGYVRVEGMVRPAEMVVLLLSVHPLLDQSLLHLHPTPLTDLPS